MNNSVFKSVICVCLTAIIITGLVLGFLYVQSEKEQKYEIAKEVFDIMASDGAAFKSDYYATYAYRATRFFDDLYTAILGKIGG